MRTITPTGDQVPANRLLKWLFYLRYQLLEANIALTFVQDIDASAQRGEINGGSWWVLRRVLYQHIALILARVLETSRDKPRSLTGLVEAVLQCDPAKIKGDLEEDGGVSLSRPEATALIETAKQIRAEMGASTEVELILGARNEYVVHLDKSPGGQVADAGAIETCLTQCERWINLLTMAIESAETSFRSPFPRISLDFQMCKLGMDYMRALSDSTKLPKDPTRDIVEQWPPVRALDALAACLERGADSSRYNG